MARHAGRIAGWGSVLGERMVTNDDLSATLDTSDEWITARTGIRSRQVGGSTTSMAIKAGESALTSWGGDRSSISSVVVATTTPDQVMPASASFVQSELGLTAGAFDLNAACSGFVYALVNAYGMVAIGSGPVLVIGADAMSQIVDWDDRGTAILFGDGAGAVVVEPTDGPGDLLGWDLGSDGTAKHILYADRGSTIVMDGKEVFRRAVRVVVDSVNTALAQADLSPADVDLFVPHQANERIINAACSRLGIDTSKAVSVLGHTGNTSAASIPLALTTALDDSRAKSGDIVAMSGFGAGMSWASVVLQWQR